MAGSVSTLLVGVILVLISSVYCNEDFLFVNNRMDGLDEDIILLKSSLARVEERVRHRVDSVKKSVQSEIKEHISEHVREAIAGILQGESIEEMVRSQILMEVRQLKEGSHQMKRQLHRVLMSLRDVQKEMNSYKDAQMKAEKDSSEMKVCSQYIIESEKVKNDLKKCKVQNEEYKQYMERYERDNLDLKQNLETLNKTSMLQDEESNISTSTVHGLTSSHELTTTSMATSSTTTAHGAVSSYVTTTTFPSVSTSPSTTAKSEEERSRIILVPLWSPTQQQFQQLDIDRNILSTYQLRSLKQVTSVTYVSKLRKLLIGLYDPDRIVSSNLDTYYTTTIKRDVKTYGMTVDEERELVFMTTDRPPYTISRMTTQGRHFTVIINLKHYGSNLQTIAVDPLKKMIYTCNNVKVVMLSYDGHGLKTLDTGRSVLTVTLDNIRDFLYYNIGKKLMRMSLSDGAVTNVTTLDVYPFSIIVYKDTVYYSNTGSYPTTLTIGTVDVGNNVESNILQTISIEDGNPFAMCLVP